MRKTITAKDVREWFEQYEDDWIEAFLEEGLADLIEDLEQDDFFGTEGFNKRFGK
jgi:hypothetical protein